MSDDPTPETVVAADPPVPQTAELRTITPEWAAEVLAKNTVNRPPDYAKLKEYIEDMQSGRWKLNGETIKMNEDHLIDGQHRLMAVVRTGISIQAWVVGGVSSDVFDTIDIGKRRSAADTLAVIGENNTGRLASSLILIDRYETGRVTKAASYSNIEIQELLKKYPEARQSLQISRNPKGLILTSILDACHYLFSRKDPALADEFVEKVLLGTDLSESSPWYVLREKLLANSASKAKLSRAHIMALCIKAWNCARVGTVAKNLRWNEKGPKPEAFPKVK